MKLPSIQQVLQESGRTFRRFPFVLAAAAVWTVVALILVDYEGPPTSSILFKILFASILGFPLLLASALFAERRGWRKSMALGVQVLCVFLLVAYALSVPSNIDAAPQLHLQRLLMLALALCLLVATAPFAATKQLNGFWHFNKSLLQRILLAGLFSATLYAGLAIAMASVDALFGVDVPEKRYGELGLFILGIFATWFFLADVPKDLNELETRAGYPRVLRVFSQYILSPMLVVYFVILYAYVVKIMIEWSWPKGMVSGTIFGFASIGISAYLLLYPMHDKSEYRWIKVATRWFWIAMIPMIVVLQLAIWRRVSEYGITENRYFALGLGVWLAAMVVYFLAGKTKNIKVIPASICVLALLTSFGPWGVFSVSEKSQVGRLEELLTKNQLLIDGEVQKAQGQIPPADAEQISSIVRYLHDMHGYERIQPWFSESLRRDSAGLGLIDQPPAFVVNALGVEYARYPAFGGRDLRELRADLGRAVNIAGYDHLLVAQRLSVEMPEFGHPSGGAVCSIDTNLDVMTLRVVQGGATVDSAQISLRPFVDSLLKDHGSVDGDSISPERMSIQTATETMRLKVVLRKIEFRREGDEFKPIAYDAVTLYSQTQK
ncbi:MAG TPA: DUF4153 domain-containing protein [Acidobacteriota bacterium]|nr:DUF4153 domain-containing protein [Acidobacteriota bacterium]